MHASSLLSLSPHLLQLFEQYMNSLRQCHHHPTSSPQKKILCNMQITGCTCIQTKQINSLQDYYLYVYMYPRGSMAI